MELIEKYGGKLQPAINKKTHILITDDKDGKGSKITKAKEMNIEIFNGDEIKLKIFV